MLHLFGVPAATDPKEQAAAREPIHRRHLLGQNNRIALNHETNATAKFDGAGRGRRRYEGDKEIIGMPVITGQLAAYRPGAAPTRGNVGMLRKPHRLKPSFLTGTGQLVWANGIISGKH